MASAGTESAVAPVTGKKAKLHGRAFYESIGSPKYILAPMVDQSEIAWRLLARSFLPSYEKTSLLAYTPMFHARLFADTEKYRRHHFQPVRAHDDPTPHLDGNPAIDRPLFVQFCANDPDALLSAARKVAPFCDAVDLNLGCPQGIAKRGHYGAFLQEDQALIHKLIRTLREELDVPVTAKIRILETREETLQYALNVLDAGASILTVHGRRREQKGHLTGLADWETLKWLREQLPQEVVMFANGNVLQHGDLEECLRVTGVDGVMSAEGCLSDPALFAKDPAVGEEPRGFWRGRDGTGGWRVDEVMRRYVDIVYGTLGRATPARRELFVPGDDEAWLDVKIALPERFTDGKKRDWLPKGNDDILKSPNVVAMQPHIFHVLRHFVAVHTDVRDAVARMRVAQFDVLEDILTVVEQKVARGILDYEKTNGESIAEYLEVEDAPPGLDESETSVAARRRCKRPWWVVQPIIRPLPQEAMAKGAIQKSKKEKKAEAEAEAEKSKQNGHVSSTGKEEGTNGKRKSDAPDAGSEPRPKRRADEDATVEATQG
ncbi:hypothetical protein OQA88_257 [Cercophora sp. LCS_1]